MDAETENDPPVQLLDLPDALILHIMYQLTAMSAIINCRGGCTRLVVLAADDVVWAPVCLDHFGLRECRAPPTADGPGAPSSSYIEAARVWTAFSAALNLSSEFGDNNGRISTLAQSAIAAAEVWCGLEQWCASNLPVLGATLGTPAIQEAWASFVTSIEPAGLTLIRERCVSL